MKDILMQQGLFKPLLRNKPESMDQDDWEELEAKAVSAIQLNPAPKLSTSIYVKLEKEDQVILLLSSLPKSYKTLKITLLIGKVTFLVDEVMLALLNSSKVNDTSSSSQGECLMVRSENKNDHGRGRDRSRSRNSEHGNDKSKSRGKQDKFSI
ncbi:hypothetical protein RJ640_001684 [Escallonia rubra]|uniref:Uncharacterized protein n=1 Tax=Escallonia rubra TaxID=112253 RepID=A0AA88S2A2_9ASTE|nr:hypothetical protein RJ640_001684 [Escallonia rubra]